MAHHGQHLAIYPVAASARKISDCLCFDDILEYFRKQDKHGNNH